MRGRKPQPTALKLAKGNPGQRHIPKREAKAEKMRITCPGDMAPGAQAAWNRLAPILSGMGVLSKSDAEALRMLCEALGEYRMCEESLRRGLTARKPKLGLRRRPEVVMCKDYRALIWRMMGDFGLTPAARARALGCSPGEAMQRGGSSEIDEWDRQQAELVRQASGA